LIHFCQRKTVGFCAIFGDEFTNCYKLTTCSIKFFNTPSRHWRVDKFRANCVTVSKLSLNSVQVVVLVILEDESGDGNSPTIARFNVTVAPFYGVPIAKGLNNQNFPCFPALISAETRTSPCGYRPTPEKPEKAYPPWR
jgi:hypothetical protein